MREAECARCNDVDARLGSVRLALGASFLIMLWFCAGRFAISAAWLILPVAGFITVVIYHGRLHAERARVQRAIGFYRAGLERIDDQWRGKGRAGTRFALPHHLYGDDLDLFGIGGLYELLCSARTPMGESLLAAWLLAPAGIEQIRQRHAGIEDLRGRSDLREALAVEGAPRIELHVESLIAWAESPNRFHGTPLSVIAPLLAILAVGAAVVWAVWGLLFPLLAMLLLEAAVAYRYRVSINAAVQGVENANEDLRSVSALLKRMEAEEFSAAPLRELQHGLVSHSQSASQALSSLASIVNFVESRRNPLLAPLLLLLMYPLQTALAAERWRSRHGSVVAAWLAALGEFETLMSLAQFSHENPDCCFPDFVEGPASFQAVSLCHPLLPKLTRVCNGVDLTGATRVLLISGSNMSGKSTLLRTVGINAVLAMCGAPVLAQSLRLTPLQIGASIRVNDSLQEGSSRFYAEITRLRQLFETDDRPLLFLLDELLQGTNSEDRRVGANGVVRALIERGSIGLISTHDLALTAIPGLPARAILNLHFQDELLDGKLYFDFKLHAGVVTKSNGIELMRAIGLAV